MTQSPLDTDPIRIGDFLLDGPLGEGAMGEVWRAHHRDLDVAVAVKVVTAANDHSEMLRDGLRREVQAMAQLRHANIAGIIDQGVITEAIDRQSAGRFPVGSPYYVLELAGGGTLGDAIDLGHMDWHRVRETLLALLAGLAHAHAHGVVHRDLKPENILNFGAPFGATRHWKLVDFGIVHSMHEFRDSMLGAITGTPAYMSPEQIMGHWRDYGPWTDLYALGCTAFEMVTGEQPFSGDTLNALVLQHLNAAPPELKPLFPVPDGFVEWVLCLLQKHPQQRFPHAADAREVLLELAPPTEAAARDVRVAARSAKTLSAGLDTQEAISTMLQATVADAVVDEQRLATDDAKTSTHRTEALAMAWPAASIDRLTWSSGRFAMPPVDFEFWTEDIDRAEAEALATASTALVGLRAPAFVGRASERGTAWQALQRIRDSKRPEALILEGPAGAGKSSMAQWLCQRFDEIGAARILMATHTHRGSAADGLAPMLGRMLRCRGLEEIPDILARLERLGETTGESRPTFVDALAAIIGDAETLQSAPTQDDRYVIIRDFLSYLARERPLVMWIDDAQWGIEALGLVRFLLANTHALPILCVLTVRSEALASAPAAHGVLDAITALPGTRRLPLAPLSGARMRELIAGRLRLDPVLARDIAKHSHGNPLFVVQLLDEWVQRGVLTATDNGYVVSDGVTPEIPADLHALWAERVAHLLQGRDLSGQTALYLAALMGQDVASAQWQRACEYAGLPAHPTLVAAMVDQGLASWTDHGFRFVHGLLRDSIVRLARDASWTQLHAWCAAALSDAPHGSEGRLGRHLAESGDLPGSLGPLLAGAQAAYQRADVDEAFALLDARDGVIERVGASTAVGIAAAVESWTLRGTICTHISRHDEAVTFLERARVAAAEHGLARLHAEALLAATIHYRNYHQSDVAQQHVRQALALFESLEAKSQAAWCRVHLGHILTNSEGTHQTQPLYADALAVFHGLDDRGGMAQCQRGLGWLRHAEGAHVKAAEHFGHAHRLLVGLGHQVQAMKVLNDLADLQRSDGELDAAEESYRTILTLFESIGHVNTAVVRLNLVMVHLAYGNFVRAKGMLERMLAGLEHDPYLQAAVHSQLLVCAAGLADWTAWDQHFAHVATWFADAVDVEADDAVAVHQATLLAFDAGALDRAAGAARLAGNLWTHLERPERVSELAHIV